MNACPYTTNKVSIFVCTFIFIRLNMFVCGSVIFKITIDVENIPNKQVMDDKQHNNQLSQPHDQLPLTLDDLNMAIQSISNPEDEFMQLIQSMIALVSDFGLVKISWVYIII